MLTRGYALLPPDKRTSGSRKTRDTFTHNVRQVSGKLKCNNSHSAPRSTHVVMAACNSGHWCVYRINISKSTITWDDSLYTHPLADEHGAQAVIHLMCAAAAHDTSTTMSTDPNEWAKKPQSPFVDVVKQKDGTNCGVFAIQTVRAANTARGGIPQPRFAMGPYPDLWRRQLVTGASAHGAAAHDNTDEEAGPPHAPGHSSGEADGVGHASPTVLTTIREDATCAAQLSRACLTTFVPLLSNCSIRNELDPLDYPLDYPRRPRTRAYVTETPAQSGVCCKVCAVVSGRVRCRGRGRVRCRGRGRVRGCGVVVVFSFCSSSYSSSSKSCDNAVGAASPCLLLRQCFFLFFLFFFFF